MSIAGVTDADNIGPNNPTGTIGAPVGYFWQVETAAGTGIFEDITVSRRGRDGARGRNDLHANAGSSGPGVARPSCLQGRQRYAGGGLLRSDGRGDGGEQRRRVADAGRCGWRSGQTLTAVLGTDPDGAGTTPTFQWFRDGVAIGGATAATFLLTATDLAHHISVQANYTDGQGFAELVTSASTGAVGAVSVRPDQHRDNQHAVGQQ